MTICFMCGERPVDPAGPFAFCTGCNAEVASWWEPLDESQSDVPSPVVVDEDAIEQSIGSLFDSETA